MSSLTALNSQIEDLETRLVKQVDERETMSTDERCCFNTAYKHIEVIDLLINTLKERTVRRAELAKQKAARNSSRTEVVK